MHLHLSTWQEIESYLSLSQDILIPTGSTEQYGPNGLIGTDVINPNCNRQSRNLAPISS